MDVTTKNSPLSLGTEKVGKLLMQYALPAIIAMTASSLYNITDSIFIGHGVGPLAIAGLAITFPLMNLAAAFGAMIGVGASTLLSVRLGQKDYETANNILGNVVTLNLILGLSYTFVMLLFLDPILIFFGASADTLPYAHDFMVIILCGNVITHMFMGLNAMLRSAGSPKKAMYATIFAVLINIVLNPLFIFVFEWGIKGSAYATVIAQVIVLMWQLKLFNDRNMFIHFRRGTFSLRSSIVKHSVAIGMAPFLMNAASCVIVVLINRGLMQHGGDMAVGAYGIVNRVAFLFIMIVIGLTQGMQPIAGYNYGAKNYSRVTDVLRKTILGATIALCVGTFIAEVFPFFVASLFTSDKQLIDMAVVGLRIVFMTYPIVGIQIVGSHLFQSIGMANKAIFLSVSRQVIFLIPFLLIFPYFWGINGVWFTMPTADVIATIITFFVLMRQLHQFKKQA
jgi:putative efflux protein, MATE family